MVSFTGHYNAISLDRLASKSKTGKDSWKRYRKIILFYVSLCFTQLQRLLFFIKTTKKPTIQQVTGGNTPYIILKRILRNLLKTPPFKQILPFQEKISFFIKNTKSNLFSKCLVKKHQI